MIVKSSELKGPVLVCIRYDVMKNYLALFVSNLNLGILCVVVNKQTVIPSIFGFLLRNAQPN